ncbi:MAG TPA: SurA N-terminal domain-containing protein, partial [Clostridia bacterium]|nr:SurA N-terminal domain-containing protein [Clostridia bacterium]
IMLTMSLVSCSNSKDNMSVTDKSKVLATVDNAEITQQQVDTRKKDSEFSQQEQDFSDEEVLDKIIEEQLLLIKAKELNITMSDDEVKQSYKEMLQLMSSKQYIDGDEDKLDKNAIEGLRNMFIIQKTKTVLGLGIDTTLEQLRQQVKIEYYD